VKSFRFIHASDLHLGAPFRGISAEQGDVASALRDATLKAYENLIELCRRKKANFVVIAGDVYNAADRSIKTQLAFRDGLASLALKGIEVFVAHGNHDPLQEWIASLSWPEGVHVFGSTEVEEFTVKIDHVDAVRVYGISYGTKHENRNLLKKFRADKDPAIFRISVLHCNCGGQVGHDPYVPCTVRQLVETGFDYWALGHVHERLELSADPHVIYPGNTQGLSIREQGPRGCYVVDVDEAGEVSLEFCPLDVIRWKTLEMDIENFQTLDALDTFITDTLETLCEQEGDRPVVCRIRLTGSGPLYPGLGRVGAEKDLLSRVRDTVLKLEPFVYVEKVENLCRPELDLARRKQEGDLLAELLKISDEIRETSSVRSELEGCLSELFENPGMRKRLDLDEIDDAELHQSLDSAERLCIDLLESSG